MTVFSMMLTMWVSTNELLGGGVLVGVWEVRREKVVVSEDRVFDIGVLGFGEVEAVALEVVLPTDFLDEVEGFGDRDREEREEVGASRACDDMECWFSPSFVDGGLGDVGDPAPSVSLAAEESRESRASLRENLRRLLLKDSRFFVAAASLPPRLISLFLESTPATGSTALTLHGRDAASTQSSAAGSSAMAAITSRGFDTSVAVTITSTAKAAVSAAASDTSAALNDTPTCSNESLGAAIQVALAAASASSAKFSSAASATVSVSFTLLLLLLPAPQACGNKEKERVLRARPFASAAPPLQPPLLAAGGTKERRRLRSRQAEEEESMLAAQLMGSGSEKLLSGRSSNFSREKVTSSGAVILHYENPRTSLATMLLLRKD